MLLSYNELEKLNIKIPLKDLENSFFQLGHEVEEVIQLNIDKMVIGEVLEVKKHENADKLSVCKVNVGSEILQIVCGAKNVRDGLKVIVALNGANIGGHEIKPVKLKGEQSNGMLCSLEELGFDKKYLDPKDYEGIYEVQENIEVGKDAFEALNLKDSMLDIFLTANRGDCQSYRGLYNDIASLLNYNNKNDDLPKYNTEVEATYEETITNKYEAQIKEGSEYFSLKLVENIEVQNSKWDDKVFLLKHQIKSQNNITDISNKMLLKYGIPSHIYDADKIEGNLKIEKLTKEENFIGLDEKEITLPINTLVIKDDVKIVCIAGVIGSNATKVTNETKNILVEVAHFDYRSVFLSSKAIGKKTDAALRYEKQIDKTIINNVLTNICNEIKEYCPNSKFSNTNYTGEIVEERNTVTLKYDNIKQILGIEVNVEDVKRILTNLEFTIQKETNDSIDLIYPAYRKDIEIENDLIEEIIRIYNIDNIKTDNNIVSFSNIEKIIPNNTYGILRNIENILLKENLNQIVSYSLVSEKLASQFLGNLSEAVKLMHPISKEHSVYRQSLIPSLIKVAKENYSYQEKSSAFFEIAKTYSIKEDNLEELNKLSILLTGDYENNYLGAKRKYNFFDLKQKIENLFNTLKLNYKFEKSNEVAELNKYASANIYINDTKIGFIGEVVFDYDKKIKETIYVLEIELDYIIKILESTNIKKYEKISFLPKIERDLTLEVAEATPYEEVLEIFENIQNLKNILLVDIYKGEPIEKGNKSITLRLTFQNEKETLLKEQIEEEINKIIKRTKERNYKISGV